MFGPRIDAAEIKACDECGHVVLERFLLLSMFTKISQSDLMNTSVSNTVIQLIIFKNIYVNVSSIMRSMFTIQTISVRRRKKTLR